MVELRQRRKAFKNTKLCGYLHQKPIRYFTLKAITFVTTIEFISIRVSAIGQLIIVRIIMRVFYCSLERLVPVLSVKLSSYKFQWLPRVRIISGWLMIEELYRTEQFDHWMIATSEKVASFSIMERHADN